MRFLCICAKQVSLYNVYSTFVSFYPEALTQRIQVMSLSFFIGIYLVDNENKFGFSSNKIEKKTGLFNTFMLNFDD